MNRTEQTNRTYFAKRGAMEHPELVKGAPVVDNSEGYADSILGVPLATGITAERIAISGSRILNIIGKVNILYNELEKFGIGLLITYAEMFKCKRLRTYIRIRWYGSKVNDIADSITWLIRNPNVAGIS
jgi:hypothetical protein